jgi:hypothetical protein
MFNFLTLHSFSLSLSLFSENYLKFSDKNVEGEVKMECRFEIVLEAAVKYLEYCFEELV